MWRILLLTCLLTACNKPRWALCEPTAAGCKVIEVYNDQVTCAFVAMGRNGKDEVLNRLKCHELPEGWR